MGENDDTIEHLIWEGYELYRHGCYTEALNAFNLVLYDQPEDAFALAGKSRVLRNLGKVSEAEQIEHTLENITEKRASGHSMRRHDPLAHFFKYYLETKYKGFSLADYLELRQQAVSDLVSYYNSPTCGPEVLSSYCSRELQEAYILRYFPHYIEPMYNELTSVLTDAFFRDSRREISVCYYGCGPAPEFLGMCYFISEQLKAVQFVNSYFFELNSWDWARTICTKSAAVCYRTRANISYEEKHNQINLTALQEPSYFNNYPEISLSKIHVFQNCLRDLEGDTGSLEVVTRVLSNTLHHMTEGSLMVIIDLNYRRTRSLLLQLMNDIEKNPENLIIRETVSAPVRIESNFERCKAYKAFEESVRKKRGTNYCSLLVAKI